jgi:hypothetical protein
MTYGLAPRPVGNGAVHWDDPAGPVRDIVKVTAPSVYSFPKATLASVSIFREYVQDYFTLRKKALVQSFYERRFSSTDSEIEERLGSEQFVDLDTPNRQLRLLRIPGRERIILLSASGARLLALPGPLPISNDPLEAEGLIWPGLDGPVVHARALGMTPIHCVYVDDRVLADYEGRTDFAVEPESGAVSFGTQWAVGYCSRVGRNLIRLELKKLYEGVPAAVTRNWHTTVQGYFYDWRDNGLFENINFALLVQAREAAGREPSPSAGVIDSQSVKTTEERRAAWLRCGQEGQGP